MADFSTPFGASSVKRLPTSTERTNGFPCGPADQSLFNGLVNRLESEVGEVIRFAGIVPTDDRFTQLREAIEGLIDAATGGGDPSQYLLVAQARVRLPIHLDVQTADGKIGITAPATGTVRVPGGVTMMHRGIYPVTTAQTDFSTNANKVYHARWSSSGGLVLEDLASTTYNPTSAAETSPLFDRAYDDALLARVVTNSNNVATITNLVNKSDLFANAIVTGTDGRNVSANEANWRMSHVLNWAETPKTFSLDTAHVRIGNGVSDGDHLYYVTGNPAVVDYDSPPSYGLTRYGIECRVVYDWAQTFSANLNARA